MTSRQNISNHFTEKKPVVASVINPQELNLLAQSQIPILVFKPEGFGSITPMEICELKNIKQNGTTNNRNSTSINNLINASNKPSTNEDTFVPLPMKQGELIITKQPNEINAIGNSRMTRCEISAIMYDPTLEPPCLAQEIRILPKTVDGITLTNFLRSISITEGKIQCSFLPMERLKVSCSKLGISFPSQIKLCISHPLLRTVETKPFKLVCRLPPISERS